MLKYYPFKKQIEKTFSLYKLEEKFLKKFFILFKQAFLIYLKLIFIYILYLILFFIIEKIKLNILMNKYQNFDDLNNEIIFIKLILSKLTNNINLIYDKLINYYELNKNNIDLSKYYLITNNIFNLVIEIFNLLVNADKYLQNILDVIFNTQIDPITSETTSNYINSIIQLMLLSKSLDVIAFSIGVIPFIGGASSGISDLAAQIWNLSDILINRYTFIIIPIINTTNHSWNNIVIPFSQIIDSILFLIMTFTGMTIFIPFLLQNDKTPLHLPVYFWLSFVISIIFMILIIFSQLLKTSSTLNQKDKQKLGKNIVGGLIMTFTSIIFVPLIFISLISITFVIINNIFNVSILFGTKLNSNFLSIFIASNSIKNGALLFPDSNIAYIIGLPKSPYGYLNGQTILLTNKYFDYTLFIVFSLIIIICLTIFLLIVMSKIFEIIQALIMGPITSSFFIKDGGLAFNIWIKSIINIFFEIIIIVLQICLLMSIANILNISLNSELSFNPILSLILFSMLLCGLIISTLKFFTNIKNIFFKDRKVNAQLNKKDFDDIKVNADIKNKELNVLDKNLSNVIKINQKINLKTQKINLNNSIKNINKLNNELNQNIKNMTNVKKIKLNENIKK